MDEKDRKFLRMAGVLSTAVLTPVFAMGIAFFMGLKLDQWLGTSPWFTGVFIVLGIITGIREVYRSVKRTQQMMDEDKDDKHD
jgi:F0F1-type ATP synthase assembly protein I